MLELHVCEKSVEAPLVEVIPGNTQVRRVFYNLYSMWLTEC